MSTRGAVAAAIAAVSVVALATGCAGSAGAGEPQRSGSAGGQLTVFAASSLTRTFTELSRQFEAAHPGTVVRVNFGGSADLVAQLQQGAPADVFAAADAATMAKAVDDRLIAGQPKDFASNSMAIAVPPGNPAGVRSFAALADPGVTVVVCAVQVPCGAATAAIERRTGVTLTPASEENAVADVLGKVTSGQADAGVVYTTDVRGAGEAVEGIDIPGQDNTRTTYPIALLSGAANPSLAGQFEQFVLSPTGQQVLADAGFGAP
ncbi:MAG: molybdate transport system substrate-binding protein [Actinomycetota bacterium]|nr:molybdate transport system substrate-binding protein [Actinomycetota bacterium]